ncbi:hypothetical protein H8D04_01395 [bacterium]|nr:hypothetical protein [bacterium]
MGNREAPYDKHIECDNCGKRGAYDFMGDYLCDDCVTSTEPGNEIPKVGLDAFNDLAESHESHVRQVEKLEEELKHYKQLDCEGVDVNSPKGKIHTVAIENIIPYMNDKKITEQTFIEAGFERTDVSIEESGADAPSHYYTYDFGTSYDPVLMSNPDFTGVNIFNLTEDYKTWKTEGELDLIFMLFLKEEKDEN